MKRNILIILIVLLILCIGFAAYRTKTSDDEPTVTGMYVTYGQDNSQHIFVDTENESLFNASIPNEKLFDQNGKKITYKDLKDGMILNIYGNGIVTESYPPTYAGIEKMKISETGTSEDAQKYQYLIDQIYQEPDPSEPSSLTIENEVPDAFIAGSMIDLGSYSLTYEDKDGSLKTNSADAPAVTEWEEYNPIQLSSKKPQLKLIFSKVPDELEIKCWPSEDTSGNGTKVDCYSRGIYWYVDEAKADCIYEIKAYWNTAPEKSWVIYGFSTKDADAS